MFHDYQFKFFKQIFIVYFLILPTSLLAQSPEIVVLKVYYKFSHQYDTIKITSIKKENYVLLLSKSSSIYKSYDRIKQDSALTANYIKTGVMKSSNAKRTNTEEFYTNFSLQKCYLKITPIDYFIAEIPFGELKWEIDKEEKRILGFNCLKATTSYHGRDYTAWFTADLPFQSGPWKLHGLPGLILSAYDKTRRIKFEISSIERVKDSTEDISISKIVKHVTLDELEEATKKFNSNLEILRKKYNSNAPSFIDKSINFPLEIKNN